MRVCYEDSLMEKKRSLSHKSSAIDLVILRNLCIANFTVEYWG
jgi:hypothetical protein